jgi:hypothetical protein
MVSRQRLWQIRRVAGGNCSNCGKPRDAFSKSDSEQLCRKCHELRKAYDNKRYALAVQNGDKWRSK